MIKTTPKRQKRDRKVAVDTDMLQAGDRVGGGGGGGGGTDVVTPTHTALQKTPFAIQELLGK